MSGAEMTKEEFKKKVKMKEEKMKLYDEVMELLDELDTQGDELVMRFFDVDSMRNLRKKKGVLQSILDGKTHEEIGKDFLDILEKIPEEFYKGEIELQVAGWTLNPKDFGL